MNITSNPTGAVVFLNDREMGRTPFKRQFLWYGTYDVVVRKEGYQTLKTTAAIEPPIWQWVPIDALTDFLPLRDEHDVRFDLKPSAPLDPAALLVRGQIMQTDLQSSEHTVNRSVLAVHPATTRATTQPSRDHSPG